MNNKNWTHAELLHNLAEAMESPYIECHLGSPWLAQAAGDAEKIKAISTGDYSAIHKKNISVPIADLIKFNPSYNRMCFRIYEVKASRDDFLGELRSGKWKKYLPYCHRFYFAVAPGVAVAGEMPPGVGLYTYNNEKKTWVCSKGAKTRDIVFDVRMLQAMIFYKQKVVNRRRFETWQMHRSKDARRKLKELGYNYAECIAIARRKKEKNHEKTNTY